MDGAGEKDCPHFLPPSQARALLARGREGLERALAVAGSGPISNGPTLVLAGVAPGEPGCSGGGMTISWGFGDTPFGRCLLGLSPQGICHLSFSDSPCDLQREWPGAGLRRDDRAAAELAARIFRRHAPPFPLPPLRGLVCGTPFQLKVWQLLLHVQHGTLVSYGQLAAASGQPRAARAVGTAVGRNPLAWLIPCHRVIRESGEIGNYHWGRERKQAMLAWECMEPPPPAEAGPLLSSRS